MMKSWSWVLSAVLVVPVFAEIELGTLFSDGMVLQRNQNVPVWGWTDPGAEVTVSFAGQEKTAVAGDDGKFVARLDPLKVSARSRVLTVASGEERIAVENVLVGEVWLCSGQSNMQWPVRSSKDAEAEIAAAKYPLIRMFLADLTANIEAQDQVNGAWKVCWPKTVADFSATAYFFGRELHEELDVPIGLIRSCWGGTPIEAWTALAEQEKYPAVMKQKAAMDEQAAKFDEAAVEARFAKKMEAWKEASKQAKADGKKAPRRPKKQVNPHVSQRYPGNLYNAMIHPLVPYGVRGAIWYQGEANAHGIDSAELYRDQLENMVASWRADWSDEFPFYAVQLVNFKETVAAPTQDTAWARIRESFLKFHQEVPNAGIAVGIDVGEAKDIHPKNKQAIGYRLARQALAKTYGLDVVPGGPLYTSMKKSGNELVLRFDDVGGGLEAKGGGEVNWFAIAGEDRNFVAAEARIEGDTVIVSAESVANPVAARYAWANNPEGCNLFNVDGFPASPFRTDDWAAENE